MKTLQKLAFAFALIILIASCQSGKDPMKMLSNKDTRKVMMDTIANNSGMMNEMMQCMMDSKNGKMIMQGNERMSMLMMQNQETMINMLKNNPEITKGIMSDMMEASKSNPEMMASLCKTIIANKQLMGEIQKMKGENKGKSTTKTKTTNKTKKKASPKHK